MLLKFVEYMAEVYSDEVAKISCYLMKNAAN